MDHLVNNAGLANVCWFEEVPDVANFKQVLVLLHFPLLLLFHTPVFFFFLDSTHSQVSQRIEEFDDVNETQYSFSKKI